MFSIYFQSTILASCFFASLSTARLIPRQATDVGVGTGTSVAPQASTTTNTTITGASVSVGTLSSPTAELITPVPSVDVGLGFWQLMNSAKGQTVNNKIIHPCQLNAGGANILGCKSPFVMIGSTYCEDMNGRHSVNFCNGVITVDFPPTVNAPTYIHYTTHNGSYTGCTAPGKSTRSSCINNQLGQGAFGSPDFVGDWCVADITQYQKSDPGKSSSNSTAGEYGYEISIYDSATDSTASGSKNGRNLIASTKSGTKFYGAAHAAVVVNFDGTASKLPGSFSLTSGNVDSDPYTLSYANPYLTGTLEKYGTETFNAYDTTHQCSLANVYPNGGHGNTWGYDGGKRLNTCGFKC